MLEQGGRGTMMGLRGVIGTLRINDSITAQKVEPGTVRRILPYANQYRRIVVLLLLVTALDSGITVASPLLLATVIDRGILPHRLDVLIVLSLAMVMLGVVDALAQYLETWSSARIGQGLLFNLRSQVFP